MHESEQNGWEEYENTCPKEGKVSTENFAEGSKLEVAELVKQLIANRLLKSKIWYRSQLYFESSSAKIQVSTLFLAHCLNNLEPETNLVKNPTLNPFSYKLGRSPRGINHSIG